MFDYTSESECIQANSQKVRGDYTEESEEKTSQNNDTETKSLNIAADCTAKKKTRMNAFLMKIN